MLLDKLHSLSGRVLIASPLIDKNSIFYKSIVYILSHDKNGIFGVIVNNKIGMISAKDLFKSISRKFVTSNNINLPIIFGGPLNTHSIVAMSLLISKIDNSILTKQLVTFYPTLEIFVNDFLKGYVKQFILVRGMTSWSSPQLEIEIRKNYWLDVDMNLRLLFSSKFKNSWEYSLSRLVSKAIRYITPYTGNA